MRGKDRGARPPSSPRTSGVLGEAAAQPPCRATVTHLQPVKKKYLQKIYTLFLFKVDLFGNRSKTLFP